MAEGSVAIVTGSLGLVGTAAVRRFCEMGLDVIGIDNDLRATLFGDAASNGPNLGALRRRCPGYRHFDLDIRSADEVAGVFAEVEGNVAVVLHAAAQPSHDWAASNPKVDFEINATATLALLECVRTHAPSARFIMMSTNKVYGDLPNRLPLSRQGPRLELQSDHPFFPEGIDETMSIDRSRHSLFGVSKLAADLMVQEYASRFGLHTTVLRAGCLTGEDQHADRMHGFLGFLCAVAKAGEAYDIIGHEGCQVRDNLHAEDLAEAFARVVEGLPGAGVYNIGGGRASSVSVLEALEIAGEELGRPVDVGVISAARYGDHAWWISDTRAFQRDYPGWAPKHDARALIERLLWH